MNYRVIAGLCLALCVIFAGVGIVQGQEKGKDDAATVEKKDEKKDDAKEDAKDEEKVLTKKEFDELMDTVNTAWNKLKINARKKMGDKAAAAADEITEAAKQMLRYDGEVLNGDEKGKKARDQKDYKDWVKALEEAATDYAKFARKSDWDKADAAKDKINETCGNCHDVYEPVD